MSTSPSAAPPSDLLAQLEGAAFPLRTVEPEGDCADLAPLAGLVARARIVSVCEASHGAREIYRLKHRLIRWLVEEVGFTGVAITCSYADALPLTSYVLGGDVDPSAALQRLRWWTLDTEEVLDLARWLRELNLRTGRGVPLYGCDVNGPASGLEVALGAARLADAMRAGEIADEVWPLATDLGAMLFPILPVAQREAALAGLGRLDEMLSDPLDTLALSCVRDWALGAGVEVKDRWALKDRACAANLLRLLELGPAGGRIAVWTHNGHGRLSPHAFGITTIGMRLRDALGDGGHAVIGTALGSGAAQTMHGGELTSLPIGPPPPGSLDQALASLPWPALGLDLRRLPAEGPAGRWLASRPATRWTDESRVDEWVEADPRECYDALLFVREVEACRRLRPVRRPPEPEGAGWHGRSSSFAAPHEVTFEPSRISISRAGTPWKWGDGIVSRELPVGPTALAAAVSADGGPAWLALVAEREGVPVAATISGPVRNGRATRRVELAPPAGTTTVIASLVLSGDGRATFEEVRT